MELNPAFLEELGPDLTFEDKSLKHTGDALRFMPYLLLTVPPQRKPLENTNQSSSKDHSFILWPSKE